MQRPLDGIRVLVTRAARQAGSLVEGLRAAGAEPVLFPAIRVTEPADGGAALRTAALAIETFDWVVLGSANAAERMLAALESAGLPASGTAARWACVGPGTAGVLREAGVEPAVVADRQLAEGLLEALGPVQLAGTRVLLPQAETARPVLADGLRAREAEVHVVHAYRTLPDVAGAEEVRKRLHRGEIGAITFTSSSTVASFVDAVGPETGAALVAAIGPVTAATAAAMGMEVGVVARQHTIEGLIESLIEHYRNEAERGTI